MAVSSLNIVIAFISLIAAIVYSGQSALFIQKLNELFHWKSGCNPSTQVGNVSLHYFDIRGRAEVIRMLMEDQLIPYTDVKYTTESWPEAKIAGISAGVFTFGQVPAIVTSKNKHMVQSKVILQYLGRSVGLDCDCRDLDKCDMIAAGVDDLHQKQSQLMYNPDLSMVMRNEFVRTVLPTWFQYFENLVPNDGLHFASERLTWLDYLVFDMIESSCDFIDSTNATLQMLDNHEKESAMFLKKFEKLEQFYTYFQKRPHLEAYMSRATRQAYSLPYKPKD